MLRSSISVLSIPLGFFMAVTMVTQASHAQSGASVSPEPLEAASGTMAGLNVHYELGELTVVAHRIPLGRVLKAIGQRTGLVIESNSGPDAELVYMELGPDTVRNVLVSLLNGSDMNYILLGTRTSPGDVERLILSGRAQSAVLARGQPTLPEAHPIPEPKLYGGSGATDSEGEESNAPLATEVQAQEAPVTAPPSVQQTIDPAIVRYQQAFADAAKSGKSRDEILIELQKQQIRELDAQAGAQAGQSTPPQ